MSPSFSINVHINHTCLLPFYQCWPKCMLGDDRCHSSFSSPLVTCQGCQLIMWWPSTALAKLIPPFLSSQKPIMLSLSLWFSFKDAKGIGPPWSYFIRFCPTRFDTLFSGFHVFSPGLNLQGTLENRILFPTVISPVQHLF